MKFLSHRHVGPVLALMLLGLTVSSPVQAHDPLTQAHHHADRQAAPLASDRDLLDTVRALVTEFRETGDDRYLDDAWSSLAPSLEQAPASTDILVAAATVLQARHEFDRALAMIDVALQQSHRSNEAWLMKASILFVVGDAEAADDACRQLESVPVIVRVGCRGRAELAAGVSGPIRQRLEALLEVIDTAALAPEIVGWAYAVAGDLAVAGGDTRGAIQRFEQSLSFVERTQVRAALVDVLIDEGRLARAATILEGGSDALPLLLRQFIVAKRNGDEDRYAAEIRRVDTEFRLWIEQGDFLHAREMARFYLDVIERLTLARELSAINLDLQREPEDIRLARRLLQATSG